MSDEPASEQRLRRSGQNRRGPSEFTVICPGCGIELVAKDASIADRFNASSACLDLYWQLSALTLSLDDPDFPHQLGVDSYAAQHSGLNVKPITTVFALVGLYLTFEKGYTGRAVQLAHVKLGRKHINWPRFQAPDAKADVTVRDVLQRITASNYNEQLQRWGHSVWAIWQSDHAKISNLVNSYLKD